MEMNAFSDPILIIEYYFMVAKFGHFAKLFENWTFRKMPNAHVWILCEMNAFSDHFPNIINVMAKFAKFGNFTNLVKLNVLLNALGTFRYFAK